MSKASSKQNNLPPFPVSPTRHHMILYKLRNMALTWEVRVTGVGILVEDVKG